MAAADVPRLTVGLPVYNGELYLSEALDSILSQTYTNFEVIISDNASTDSTQDISLRYVAKDSRVHYRRNIENVGAAKNYNLLVDLARGEYFRWASHDDMCERRLFELAVAELDACPNAVLAYPLTMIIDERGAPVRLHPDRLDLRQKRPSARFAAFHRVYRRLYPCNPVFGVIRTEVLRRTGRIGRYVASDMILLGELSLYGQFHELRSTYFFRRDHPGTSVRAYPRLQARTAWFDPAEQGKYHPLRWRWEWEYLAAIGRAPISPLEKTLCLQKVAEFGIRNSERLLSELMHGGVWTLKSAFAGRRAPVADDQAGAGASGKPSSGPAR